MSNSSMFTMAMYRPHPGKEGELAEIVKGHVPNHGFYASNAAVCRRYAD